MMIVIDSPMASSAVKPKVRSAPFFQLVMMPGSVLLMIASSAESISAASQYGASSGLLRSVSKADPSRFGPLSAGVLDILCEVLYLSQRKMRSGDWGRRPDYSNSSEVGHPH